MSELKKFVVETTKSLYVMSDTATLSLGIELEPPHIERLIVGLLLIEKELIDQLIIKDLVTHEKITVERHEKFNFAITKGKLQARSIISRSENNIWMLLITRNDVDCIILRYLQGFIDYEYKSSTLDIECEDNNMLLFSTKLLTT